MSSSEDLFYSAGSGKRASGLSEARAFRLILLKRIRLRREGSLAAALIQSMALAVMGTAGAYPSWVLVQGEGGGGGEGEEASDQVVLGAAWAITREDPAPGAPLLGPAGGPLMLGMAFCCLFSVLSGTLALTLDFLGRRRGRSVAPLAHGLTAVLIACAAALGSCLLALVRGRVHAEPELRPRRLSTSPGQSLFLAFLACALASTATGLSCSSPARVEPARSSWDFRARDRPARFRRRRRPDEEEGVSSSSSSSVAAATAAYIKSKFRRGTEAGLPSESRSGKVHWPDQGTLEYLPEERAFRRRPTLVDEEEPDQEEQEEEEEEQEQEEEPREEKEAEQPPALSSTEAASLQRYWTASWSLLGSFGSLFEREPQREASAPPTREEEGEEEEEEEEEVLRVDKERGSRETV